MESSLAKLDKPLVTTPISVQMSLIVVERKNGMDIGVQENMPQFLTL